MVITNKSTLILGCSCAIRLIIILFDFGRKKYEC